MKNIFLLLTLLSLKFTSKIKEVAVIVTTLMAWNISKAQTYDLYRVSTNVPPDTIWMLRGTANLYHYDISRTQQFYGSLNPILFYPWAGVNGTPTTLSGYGIIDALQTTRTINTTSPLTGGGDLSSNRTFAISNSVADNSTKGAASFDSSNFSSISGNIFFTVKYGTGSVSTNVVTINQPRGKITYTSPSISAGTTTAVTFTNSYINSTSTINIGLNGNGSNLTLINAYVKSQTAGSCIINIQNLSLLSLFNTGFIIDYYIVN